MAINTGVRVLGSLTSNPVNIIRFGLTGLIKDVSGAAPTLVNGGSAQFGIGARLRLNGSDVQIGDGLSGGNLMTLESYSDFGLGGTTSNLLDLTINITKSMTLNEFDISVDASDASSAESFTNHTFTLTDENSYTNAGVLAGFQAIVPANKEGLTGIQLDYFNSTLIPTSPPSPLEVEATTPPLPDSTPITAANSNQDLQEEPLPSPVNLITADAEVVIQSNTTYSVGGVTTMDRERYFQVHGTSGVPDSSPTIRDSIWQDDQLNTTIGVEADATAFINDQTDAFIDPTDPNKFYAPVVAQYTDTVYNHRVNTGTAFDSFRNTANPFLIQSSKIGWPDFTATDGAPITLQDYEGYVGFLKSFLSNISFTHETLPPISAESERYFLQLFNEPEFNNMTPQQIVDFHEAVPDLLRAEFPDLKVGGPAITSSGLEKIDFEKWNDIMQPVIQTAGDELDFYTAHFYDRYDILADDTYINRISTPAGRTAAVLDLIEAESVNQIGTTKPLAATEYGSWINEIDGSPGFGDYSYEQRQWDLMRDVREKMLVFLDRPDRILSATPWSQIFENAPFENTTRSLIAKDSSGNPIETHYGKLYRLFNSIEGERIFADSSNDELQIQAYRDGNQVHVILNNLRNGALTANLQNLFGGVGSIDSVLIDRLQWSGTEPTLVEGSDVTGSWENLTLTAEEGAVLTFTMSGTNGLEKIWLERNTYGSSTVQALDINGIVNMTIEADKTDALSASIRVGYSWLLASTPGDIFTLSINGNDIMVPFSFQGTTDGIFDGIPFTIRELSVDLAWLNQGSNNLQFTFPSGDGFVSSAVLTVIAQVPEPSTYLFLSSTLLLAFHIQAKKKSLLRSES